MSKAAIDRSLANLQGWRWRRLAAGGLELRELPGAINAPGVPGIPSASGRLAPDHIASVDRPIFWRSFVIRPKQDPRSPEFSRIAKGSVVFTSEEQVDAYLDACKDYHDWLAEDADLPDEAKIGETDAAAKIVIQIGKRMDGHLGLNGPGRDAMVWPPNADVDKITAVGRKISKLLRNSWDRASRPLLASHNPHDTSSGYPLFTKGGVAKLATAYYSDWGGSPWDVIRDRAQTDAGFYGVPETALLAFGFASRAGPYFKWHPDWIFGPAARGAWPTATHEIRGETTRTRHVSMAPACNLTALTPGWQVLMAAIKTLPFFNRSGSRDSAKACIAHQLGWHFLEMDFSAFDQSVIVELMKLFAATMADAFEGIIPRSTFETWVQWSLQGYITPPIEGITDLDSAEYAAVCSIIGSSGGVNSGDKWTSLFGCWVNMLAQELAFAATRPNFLDQAMNGDLLYLAQGDDTLIATSERFSDTQLVAMAEVIKDQLGLKVEMLRCTRFLSRYHTVNGQYQIGARIIQGLSPEYPHSGKHARGMEALAFLSRTAKGVLPVVDRRVTDICLMADWTKSMSLKPGISLQDLRTTTEVAFADEMELAIRSKSGEHWLDRLIRDAPYSPAAESQLEYLRAIKPELVAKKEALVTNFNFALRKLTSSGSFEPSEKRDFSRRLGDAALRGTNEIDLITAIHAIETRSLRSWKAQPHVD